MWELFTLYLFTESIRFATALDAGSEKEKSDGRSGNLERVTGLRSTEKQRGSGTTGLRGSCLDLIPGILTWPVMSSEWQASHPIPGSLNCFLERSFPGGISGKNPPANAVDIKRCGFDPWVEKIPWRSAWQPTPVFLPGKSHGHRNLASYSPMGLQRVGYSISGLYWTHREYTKTVDHCAFPTTKSQLDDATDYSSGKSDETWGSDLWFGLFGDGILRESWAVEGNMFRERRHAV